MLLQVDGVALGRWTEPQLATRLAWAEGQDLSYDHPRSTLALEHPDGVPEQHVAVEVDGDLADARAALDRWAAHDGIRARIRPRGAPIEPGRTVLVVAALGPFEMAVPNRIVAVLDEPGRFGFAYGTLQGHAERGEELFLAEQLAPGRLRLSLRIHAHPASVAARLAAPLVLRIQAGASGRYLQAWTAALDGPRPGGSASPIS